MKTDGSDPTTWRQALAGYIRGVAPLFDESFFARWGDQNWSPCDADKNACAQLHTQIVSRITTQPLGYLDGVELAALHSLYQLFDKAREILDKNFGATHFDTLVWQVLNVHVRPFTAKWHRRSQEGSLSALDETDDFRAELSDLQPLLLVFDELLIEIRDGKRPPPSQPASVQTSKQNRITQEIKSPLPWGISPARGGLNPTLTEQINQAEKAAISARRQTYGISKIQSYATGLALSGGGIRSATFSLGVLIALSRRNLLPQFDYLSTVSGGGYLGSFLTTFLSQSPGTKEEVGLKSSQLPFHKEDGEAEALRHIRHNSKYLQTSAWERVKIATAQVYGMLINFTALALIPAFLALFEYLLRWSLSHISNPPSFTLMVGILISFFVITPLAARFIPWVKRRVDVILAVQGSLFTAFLAWKLLDLLHANLRLYLPIGPSDYGHLWILGTFGALPLAAAGAVGLLGRHKPRLQIPLAVLASLAIPIFFLGVELAIYDWLSEGRVSFSDLTPRSWQIGIFLISIFLLVLLPLDVNFTSLHRHYRRKLSEVYLIRPTAEKSPETPFETGVSLKLSEACLSNRSPYHLINAALNVPSSKNPAMQGRLTDFFLFSPSYCGSPLVGYQPTKSWEEADPSLDIGTAMATSGAAASPLMGLATQKYLRVWLALLNVRLGYWVKKPTSETRCHRDAPGIKFLLGEIFGKIDENSRYLNITDGGHIENLGIYELLRRRCKFILAVDGEHDPAMTFHAFATLQRLAAIDLNVRLEIDLDDLRLKQNGLSRSHFQLCRIHYPADADQKKCVGYLLYLKLSLTGNEGEFINRYRLDEPDFPHHSTLEQFFSEAQYEAYRSLGEHVGDKLFLKAIVGPLADAESMTLEELFESLGQSLLD